MTAAISPEADVAARLRTRGRPGRTGTTLRRRGVIGEMLAAGVGVVVGYYLLINYARHFEVRAVADILHLFGVYQISGALGTTLVIFRPHGETISAALTPSCSSLMSVLALAGLASSVLRRRRAHTLAAFVVATILLVAANISRITASALAGLWFGKPSLLLFHDWVGTIWNFAGTLAGFLLLVALTLPSAERAEQDSSGRHTAGRPSGWGRSGLGYRVPALDKSRRPHRRTLTSLAMRYLLPGFVSRRRAQRREARRIDYRIGHLAIDQRIEAVTELARPGLGVHTASLLAVATYDNEIPVLDSLASAVVTRQWEPVSTPAVASLRLWARGWLMKHPLPTDPHLVPSAMHAPTGATPTEPAALVAPAMEEAALVAATEARRRRAVNGDVTADRTARTGRTVVVTGAGGPAGVGVVQSLVGAGHRVIAVDSDPLAAGFRLAAAGVVVPRAGDPGYAEALLGTVTAAGAEALICTVVEEYPPLTALVPELVARGCRTWLPELAAAELCNDKDAFAKRMRG